jgi:glycosyltransferase involved in cell wall biosynthesis
MDNNEAMNDFTVLMAVYGKDDPSLLRMAINSVFSNSLCPKKLIVVADGPLNSDLDEILSLFIGRENFFVIRSERNIGLAGALNIGLNCIETKYTIRADSDDFNYPDRFSRLISTLEYGYDLVGSSILEVDKQGNKLAVRKPPLAQREILLFARKRNPFNHMTVGFRTSTVLNAGGYPSIYLKEDYALWVTLLEKKARVCNIGEILVNATTGKDMYRRRGGFKYAIAEVDMQIHLVRVGMKGPLSALIDGLFRSMVFLAPRRIREFVYLKFLRLKAY